MDKEGITEAIVRYSETPCDLRDAPKLVDDILHIDRDHEMQGRGSILSIAASAAGALDCLDLFNEFSSRVKRPADRVDMLVAFTNHLPAPGSPALFDAIYSRFEDVINEPCSTGRMPLFYAMQLEVQGCKGIVESALRHGADPYQLTPEWAGKQEDAMSMAMDKADSPLPPTASPATRQEKECWREIVSLCTEYGKTTDFQSRIVKSFDGMWRH